MRNSKTEYFCLRRDLPTCPKCGKRGKKQIYKNGEIQFVHIQQVKSSPFPHIDVLECCSLPSLQVPHE